MSERADGRPEDDETGAGRGERAGSPERSPRGAAATADRVGTIVAAAEHAAEEIRLRTEGRMRERIAEGERAAENRVTAAEHEAADIVREAHGEAERAKTMAASEALAILAKAHDDADKTRNEAEQAKTAATAEALELVTRARTEAKDSAAKMKAQSLEALAQARIAAADVRAEGMELVNNLREMGDALRSNSERLLRDVQAIHSRMVAELDQVDGGASRLPTARDSSPRRIDDLDVPEFIPPG